MTLRGVIENPKLRRYAWVPALLAYALWVFYVTAHHEPWRDEADAWLMVRDNNLLSLWHRMGYAGTPGLWYLLLMPWVKLGLGIQWQLFLNNAIAIAAAGLVLIRLPLHRLIRLGIVFSYFMAFEYAVISRSYGLGMLLLFAAASLFSRRFKRPWTYGLILALLANTNVHSLLLAGSLLAISLWDGFVLPRQRGKSLRILGLGGLGVVLAVWQLWPPADGQIHALILNATDNIYLVFLAMIHEMVVPTHWISVSWLGTLAVVANITVWIACTVMVVRKSFRASCFLIVSFLALWGLYAFVYYGGIRHAGIFYLVLIAALWMSYDQEENQGQVSVQDDPKTLFPRPSRYRLGWLQGALGVGLLISVGMTGFCGYQEITMLFSGAKQAGAFITEHGLGDETIAGFREDVVSAVLPHIPQKKIWYAGSQDFGSFMKWDMKFYKNLSISPGQAFQRIKKKFGRTHPLLLFNYRMIRPERVGYVLIYQTTGPIWGVKSERFYLYARLGG